MAMLKDSLIAGDLRVTGTIYGDANLGTLNASGTGLGTNGQILKTTGTGLAWVNAADTHNHDSLYVNVSGDTMTGALNFANNVYNKVGDDVQIGDINQAGKLGIKGINGATGIQFVPYSGSTSQTLSIDGAGQATLTSNFTVSGTTDATSSTAATLISSGGLAVNKKAWIGGGMSAPTNNNNNTSQLIISSSDTAAGGIVALELWRGTNASWQLSNEGGNLHFRTNYTTAKQTAYSVDAVSIAYNSGNVTVKGTVTAPTFSGALSGNASTATKFSSNQSITLTGDTTGTASSQAGWSIATTTKKLSQTDITNLSSFTDENALIYAAQGGSNSVTDKPTGVDAFGVISLKTAAGWYGQLLISSNNSSGIYWRTATSLSGGWRKIYDTSNKPTAADVGLGNVANKTITVTTTSVSDGTTTFNKYSHPTSAGNKHIPSGGSTGQLLKYSGSSGTAAWSTFTTNTPTAVTKKTVITGTQYDSVNEILTFNTGDSVTVTAGTAASFS